MKKTLIMSISVGVILSLFIYFRYKNSISTVNKIGYLIQIGAFSKIENANNIVKNYESYLIKKENDLYHVYIGFTMNYENINKINYNNYEIVIKKININNSDFIKYVNKYDDMLINVNSFNEINNIEGKILKKYKNI